MQLARRTWLTGVFGGLSGLAAARLLAEEAQRPRPEFNGGLHHPARARRIIQVFLNGGMSQVDTFDYKPELIKRHGQVVDVGLKATATSTPGPVMKSPFAWKQHGQCGRWVTEVFPCLARHVDEMAFLMAMQAKTNVHGPASYLQNTGFLLPGFPCAGAWISYALGRLTDNLPTFVVLPDARGLPYNGAGNFSAGFLPAAHQGAVIDPSAAAPIPDLAPAPQGRFVTPSASAAGMELLQDMNRRYAAQRPGDSRLESRIESYEIAARMQLAAPEAFDLRREPRIVHDLYGTEEPAPNGPFARNCLLARRLIERGVRFVQIWSGNDNGFPRRNWDSHEDVARDHAPLSLGMARGTAALIMDLKQRGLLEDTIILWTTEFGRMPCSQGSKGRDHNPFVFTNWLCGGGVRGGTFGESDEWGFKPRNPSTPTTVYDIHATILHLLGTDHTRLTVRHNSIDRRLTDVHGEVLREVLA
jgi:hypothetical protein